MRAKSVKNPRNKKALQWPFLVVFLLGFLILMYPVVSRWYYRVEATRQVQDFDSAKGLLAAGEVQERLDLAKAFNESLTDFSAQDPYTAERRRAGRVEYARMLEINEQIGHVQIPRIDVDIPIYAGSVEEVLQKGVGHLEGTSLPVGGNNTHAVLTAHSGLPKAKLFSDLKELEVGDKFYVHNLAETLAYQVDQILTVEPSNFQDLMVVPGHDYRC